MASTERKYQTTRIKSGDYIVPCNTGEWLFRVTSYDIDDKATWTIHRYTLPVRAMSEDLPHDFLDWDNWEYEEGGFSTKRDALAAAVILR